MTGHFAVPTPLGNMTAAWSERGLAQLSFGEAKDADAPALPRGGSGGPRGGAFLRELARYFKTGEWRFTIPLDLSAGTDFDRAIWRALRRIPAGKVRTYGDIARAIGRPRAARAVGNACGRNPVMIVVPCHRVVAANGLGGFGAGLAVKRRLLELEGVSA